MIAKVCIPDSNKRINFTHPSGFNFLFAMRAIELHLFFFQKFCHHIILSTYIRLQSYPKCYRLSRKLRNFNKIIGETHHSYAFLIVSIIKLISSFVYKPIANYCFISFFKITIFLKNKSLFLIEFTWNLRH
jgi:hypothetical protein